MRNFKKHYRVMWDQNSGLEGFYDPPMSPEQVAQAHTGFFEGRPVDAYVGALGCNAGYGVSWPTEVKNAEFWVDRLNAGARVGKVQLWRHAENLRLLWEQGVDPLQLEVDETKRLGVDHWFRLSMNDWHHWGTDNTEINLQSSSFYDNHPEYLIGEEGARGWNDNLAKVLQYFQDWMHDEVRALRRDIAVEACTRYDVAGFLYDFMRCPGYFKFGQEQAGLEVMSDFMRETREHFRVIEKKKGCPLGLAVRVPSTIDGSLRLGLDVCSWINEGLVDLVVPSCFFGQDMEEDVSEWVELSKNSGVQVYPAIEEGYMAGHTGEFRRWYLNPPIMTPLSNEMVRGLATRHLQRGSDGIYVFNFFGTCVTYDYDNRNVVDDIADLSRLEHKDKTFALTRSNDSFPNCLITERLIPTPVTEEKIQFKIHVTDNLTSVQGRLRSVDLCLHLDNLTVYDVLEVTFNGTIITYANSMKAGEFNPTDDEWLRFDLLNHLPIVGDNLITLRMVKRNPRLADEIPVELVDVELHIKYAFPDGEWEYSRSWKPPR